jgi:hypothetical protein
MEMPYQHMLPGYGMEMLYCTSVCYFLYKANTLFLFCFALLCFALLGATHGSVCTREFMVLPLGGGWHSYTYLSMHYGLPICTGGVGGALCFDVCMNEALEEFLKWRSHLF